MTQNGNFYRCFTRTRTNNTKKRTFVFDCSKRRKQNCPFRFQAKVILTNDPKNNEFWIKENWKILEVLVNHTCDETERERKWIKQEKTRVKDEKIKKIHTHERIRALCENFTELPTIVSVLRHEPSSKSPILLLKQNGKNYRCRKVFKTRNHINFNCPKRNLSGCSFRMVAKMLITQNPANEDFWSTENWEILDLFALHTCTESALIGNKWIF